MSVEFAAEKNNERQRGTENLSKKEASPAKPSERKSIIMINKKKWIQHCLQIIE